MHLFIKPTDMQTQTSIYIPKPCHEDWNKMKPTQQGKFCSACNKQVVDFSLMSDNQIIHFLSHQSGKLCGRFDAEQLQRPLVETKIKKKKNWWMAFIMPLLFLFERSEAQENKVGDTIYNSSMFKNSFDKLLLNKAPFCEPTTELTGTAGMVSVDVAKQTIIKGKVVDENNNLVPFATIIQKGTKHATAADAEGKFLIKADENKRIILIASAVGFENVERTIEAKQNDSMNIVMKKTDNDLGGVVVVVAGGIVPLKPIKPIDTIKTIVREVFKLSVFKIYPNPVVHNDMVNIQIKNAGDYQMQLLDNQSRLIMSEEINAASGSSTKQIQLQSNIAAGIYYLRLINEQTKKSYTEKLIIQ